MAYEVPKNWLPESPWILNAPKIDVWCFRTDLPVAASEGLRALLSEAEATRAARFRFERHRVRWTAARAGLRVLLARYVGNSPQELVFKVGPHGKPFLRGRSIPYFNLSHSGDLALLAVTGHAAVGVDVERLNPRASCDLLARRFFSEREKEWLRGLEDRERLTGFFRIWVVKEAVLKASGVGLSVPLRSVEVLFESDGRVTVIGESEKSEPAWRVFEVPIPVGGYQAAVALPQASQ